VASHVVEHIPNPVMFFQAMARVLKPGGPLSLAVPDKRYCFVFFQPLTCTGDWLHAWKRQARTHSQRALFQHIAYTVSADGATTWGQFSHLKDIRFLNQSLTQALKHFNAYDENGHGAYQDCHAWHFTPGSFDLLVLELSQLGLIPFTVVEAHPACGCKFFILLRMIAEEQVAPMLLLQPNPVRSFLDRLRHSLAEFHRCLRRGGRSCARHASRSDRSTFPPSRMTRPHA
jgi:SAM-dependent methyltransferase